MHYVLSLLALTFALVNPSLQPLHLWERYQQVVTLRIVSVDEAGHALELELVTTHKGGAGTARIHVAITGEEAGITAVTMQPGQVVVALVGETRHGGDPTRVVFYAGTRQPWQQAKVGSDGAWAWAGRIPDENDMTQGFGPLWGTWNGHVDQLDRLFADLAAARHYFPTNPLPRFAPEQVLASAPAGAVRGLALRDLDSDGVLSLIVAGSDRVRVLTPDAHGAFTDTTVGRGLAGITAGSIAVADFNGDGKDDLLLDGQLWTRTGAVFIRDQRLPAIPDVLVGAAVEWDGDGWPDILLSTLGGGLRLWRNPGPAGGAFVEVSEATGLEVTAGLTGYVAPGDWEGDGRLALFYAAKKGLLLVQGANHRFARVPFSLPNQLSFTVDGASGPGMSGASMFAPLWSGAALDVLITTDPRFAALTRLSTGIDDATTSGNEFADGAAGLHVGLAEDLNVDGCLDILGCSASPKQGAIVIASRNYGSYMRLEKYNQEVLPGRLNTCGALGAVAADLDGDGATDLVIAAADGTVGLYHNASLADRPLQADENARLSEAAIASVRIIRVRLPPAQGTVGALIRVSDATGHDLTRRYVGAEVLTGCRGPDQWSLAVRATGTVMVTVRFSDGVERQQTVRLPTDRRMVEVTVQR